MGLLVFGLLFDPHYRDFLKLFLATLMTSAMLNEVQVKLVYTRVHICMNVCGNCAHLVGLPPDIDKNPLQFLQIQY